MPKGEAIMGKIKVLLIGVFFLTVSLMTVSSTQALSIFPAHVQYPNGVQCDFHPPELWDGRNSLMVCYSPSSAWATVTNSRGFAVEHYYSDWTDLYYSQYGDSWSWAGSL